jgi:hypothetical protein
MGNASSSLFEKASSNQSYKLESLKVYKNNKEAFKELEVKVEQGASLLKFYHKCKTGKG